MKQNWHFKTTSALALISCLGMASAPAAPWKFGILSDTQWVTSDDGKSPESIPASIIQQVDKEFIAKGVKVVIAVGDTVDTSQADTLDTRALYSQDIYNAGIGFYPLRGNHDAGLRASGTNFATLFPQIVNGGTNNLTPLWDTPLYIESLSGTFSTYSTLLADFGAGVPPVSPRGGPFQVGGNFSYPGANGPLSGVPGVPAAYPGVTSGNGLSYSFDLENTRFILLDQFVDSDPGGNTSTLSAQQPWLTSRLADANRPTHALVFSHKNILGGDHKDNLFGANVTAGASGDPGDGACSTNGLSAASLSAIASKQAAEDAFLQAMATNSARLLITGHDHHHAYSLVHSPLHRAAAVHQLIAQSDSNKFYTPAAPFSTNEVSISEDLYELGYYIGTVDGPRLTIDYYAVPTYAGGANVGTTPVLTGNWQKMLTFGYSLNGQEFDLPAGASYTAIGDDTALAVTNAAALAETGFVGTRVQFLSGVNGSTLKTHDGRALTKAINTGWAPAAPDTISDVLTVWGMTDLSAIQGDTVTIALSMDASGLDAGILAAGGYCLGARELKSAAWINAVDGNIVGGSKKFINGAWSASYGLGCYGAFIDSTSGKAVFWAVINGSSREFAVIDTASAPLAWDFNGDGKVDAADAALLNAAIRTHSADLTYDLTGDGKVDASDLRWLTQHYTNAGGR